MSLPLSKETGLHLTCSRMHWVEIARSTSPEMNLDIPPGGKWALVCPTESIRHHVSLALAGLEQPPTGVVRYNGVDIRNVSMDQLNVQRGIVFGRDLTLFEGTVTENVTMDRSGVESDDLLWAVRTVRLEQELEELPDGLQTKVKDGGRGFTPSQRLRLLLARTIITYPRLLILDGALHEIQHPIREAIFDRLRAPGVPWTLVVVTTDPHVNAYVEKCVSLF